MNKILFLLLFISISYGKSLLNNSVGNELYTKEYIKFLWDTKPSKIQKMGREELEDRFKDLRSQVLDWHTYIKQQKRIIDNLETKGLLKDKKNALDIKKLKSERLKKDLIIAGSVIGGIVGIFTAGFIGYEMGRR